MTNLIDSYTTIDKISLITYSNIYVKKWLLQYATKDTSDAVNPDQLFY